MFIVINDANKPCTLDAPIDNQKGNMKIGICIVSWWVGWYNIYEEQTCRWGREGEESTEIIIPAGLYDYKQITQLLTDAVEGLIISINPANGLIDMTIPAGVSVYLTEAVRYLLGIEKKVTMVRDSWLRNGYDGDRAVDFVPKSIHIYLKQLSTSENFLAVDQRSQPSQLLGFLPLTLKSKNLFGGYIEKSYATPIFKALAPGMINELEFDFKVNWGNGAMHKLDNHSQPIRLELEVKKICM